MTTTVIDLSVERSVMLNLGRVGENGITEFVFDYANWTDEFGEGVLSLVLKRQGDAEGYPKSMTVESGQSTWVVDSTDVGVEGIGEAQLTYTVNGDAKKSVIYLTRTCPSIEPVGPAPDPYQSWLDQMIEAKEDAENAAERAETAAENLDTKGYYPDMRVGTADNLLSSSYVSDSEPYTLRRTPYGARERGSIVGGSIVWNQLIDVTNISTQTKDGVTYTNNGDGSYTLTGTPTSTNCFYNIDYVAGVNPYNLDHIYLLFSGYTGEMQIGVRIYGIDPYGRDTYSKGYSLRKAAELTANGYVRIQVSNLKDTDIGTVKLTPQLFDLTLMFGPTIADYIYTQEQATTGSGVALAKALAGITADYYPYDAGSIKSVEGLTAHRMTDGNGDVIGEYPLDSSLTLRGLPKLDGDSIYYDGDVYKADGTVTRRYGVVDLGTLTWSAGGASFASNTFSSQNIPTKAYGNVNFIANGYTATDSAYLEMQDKTIRGNATGNRVYIRDTAYTDATAFKNAMSGVYLVYELAEPTTEQAEPYTALQICDTNGTEEWVGALMPVGHDTKYYADLKGKLEDIPNAPSADGTYTLRVTVSNGVATYSWE